MRLVDSSAWIEFLSDTSFGRTLARSFPKPEEWLIPTIVQFELSKWYWREGQPDKAEDTIAFAKKCVVVDLDTATALAAADLWGQHRLSAADAIIYATALAYHADLLTCDRHFEGLPGVIFVDKPGLH